MGFSGSNRSECCLWIAGFDPGIMPPLQGKEKFGMEGLNLKRGVL
jgi:hypothetical protein